MRHFVGKINRAMFLKISREITTEEVIITDERIEHSNKHQNAYDKYGGNIGSVLSDPDFIFVDAHPNTAILIREIQANGISLQIVLRLHVPSDEPGYQNSVISFWNIGQKRKENYRKNKKSFTGAVIYSILYMGQGVLRW